MKSNQCWCTPHRAKSTQVARSQPTFICEALTVECSHQGHAVWDMTSRASPAGLWPQKSEAKPRHLAIRSAKPRRYPKQHKNPARKPLKQMHQDKLARHVDYIQAALTRRALVQPYVEPMCCSYIPDAGFANPQGHAHARRLYTRRDGLRSPPSKLYIWCCARLPLLRERHLPEPPSDSFCSIHGR